MSGALGSIDTPTVIELNERLQVNYSIPSIQYGILTDCRQSIELCFYRNYMKQITLMLIKQTRKAAN
jgi:hypothetical protein